MSLHARLFTAGALTAALWASVAAAQPGRIPIELATVAEADTAHAGTTFRVAVQARLEPGFHVNSQEPLEAFLIPTVLTLDPPAGIELAGLAWPTAILLSQTGADQPLAVFEETFAIGAALALDSGLAPGDYAVPGVLRYQACDETMCYLPATAPARLLRDGRAGDAGHRAPARRDLRGPDLRCRARGPAGG